MMHVGVDSATGAYHESPLVVYWQDNPSDMHCLCRSHDEPQYERVTLSVTENPPTLEPRLDAVLAFECGVRLRYTKTSAEIAELSVAEFWRHYAAFSNLAGTLRNQADAARIIIGAWERLAREEAT